MKLLGLMASMAFMASTALTFADAAWAVRSDGTQQAPAIRTISYGSDELQALDFHPAQMMAGEAAPLVLFVHGGGWSRGDKGNATGRLKAPHYTALGYHFATTNYRLVPEATVEQQAQDVADALAALLIQADTLGIDRKRVALMGHSAGAHLVALVGTDPKYLRQAGLGFEDIAGVIPLDGAAYDVGAQMAYARWPALKRRYEAAFGQDPARQARLSPTVHASGANAPRFLLLHLDREDGKQQAQGLANALHEAGTDASVRAIPGKGLRGHMQINRRLGEPDYAATSVVDEWLELVFRQT